MVKAAVPVFVSVTVLGVLAVTRFPYPTLFRSGANPAPGAVPLPVSATVCGLPPALSTTDSVPVRAPETVGVKVTSMVQFAPAANVAGLVGQAIGRAHVCTPATDIPHELMVAAAMPVF